MVDITAKRGPRDPAEGLTNQGVATQAKLNSMAMEHQYELQKKLKEKSTWDSIVGGISDVINIGKGVMDIANSYEDLGLKEEKIKQSELMRQQQELNLETSKQQMGVQSLQNEMQLKELTADNEFLDTINTYIKSNDYTGAVNYAYQYPKIANKYQSYLLNVAKQLENNGDTETAEAFRLAVSPEKVASAYGSFSVGNTKFANPRQAKSYLDYTSYMDALKPYLTSVDNGPKIEKLGLKQDDPNLANNLLSCVTKISSSNTSNSNTDRAAYLQSLNIKSLDNLSNLQSSTNSKGNGKNVQLVDVTCSVDGVPHTEQFELNANDKIRVNQYNDKGVITGAVTLPINTAVGAWIAAHDDYIRLTRESINNTAKVAQAEQAMQTDTDSRTEDVIDTRELESKQQTSLVNKDYDKYSEEVSEELKQISNVVKSDPQALAAIINDKVATLSQDPDALNSYINNPLNELYKTLSANEQEALEIYIPRMSTSKKQELANIIMTSMAKRNTIEDITSKLKDAIYRSSIFNDILKNREEQLENFVKEFKKNVDYHTDLAEYEKPTNPLKALADVGKSMYDQVRSKL